MVSNQGTQCAARPTVCMVGAGRLATNLAPALQQGGAEVVEVWSRTRSSASVLADRLGCHASWGRFDAVTRDADLYLISVADAALPQVIAALKDGRERALMAHTAGSMPLSLFRESGVERGGVFYPMQTFSKERQVDFGPVHFFIEAANPDDEKQLMALASTVTSEANVHACNSAVRRRLHLAAVFACNFANHCFAMADEVLAEADLPFAAMLPLVEETVSKLRDLSPAQAQTGPAVRGDTNVMGAHMAMLAGQPRLQKIYRMMSDDIAR